MHKKIVIFVLIGIMVMGLMGCTQKDPEKVILANINEETITLAKLNQYFAIYNNADTGEDTSSQEVRKGILNEVVEMKLITQYMNKKGIEVDEDTKAQYNSYIEQIRADEEASKYMKDKGIQEETLEEIFYSQYYMMKLSDEITAEIGDVDKAVETYYNEHKEDYIVNEVKASHILVDTEETAKEVLAKIEEGQDFGELAKEYSKDSSAANGGDLGYFVKEAMVAPFAEAAFALEIGQVSGIVQTQFGYHIIKCFDKRTRQMELEEAYQSVASGIYEEKYTQKIEDMKKEIAVKEYPDKLK